MFLFIFREYPGGFPAAALLWFMTVTEERKNLLPFSLSIQSRDWIPSRRPGEMAILQQHDNNITIDNTKQNFNCECYTLYSCIDTTSWRLFFFFFPNWLKAVVFAQIQRNWHTLYWTIQKIEKGRSIKSLFCKEYFRHMEFKYTAENKNKYRNRIYIHKRIWFFFTQWFN